MGYAKTEMDTGCSESPKEEHLVGHGVIREAS